MKHLRNLLVLPALFAVAPLSAHESETAVADATETGCPYEHAAGAGAGASAQPVVVIDRAPERSSLGAAGGPSEIFP